MINSLLFSIQNTAPALLSIGTSKLQNYSSLEDLTNQLYGQDKTNKTENKDQATDKVTIAFKEVSTKMLEEVGAITAEAITKYPDLAGDYMVAIIDDGKTREARVYRRSDILKEFEGTDEEKTKLKEGMDKNPITFYKSADDLPKSANDDSANTLAFKLSVFLQKNATTLDQLTQAGYNPFKAS